MIEPIHVVPVRDLREHETDQPACQCHPSVELVPGALLVVHNAWDKRELREVKART